MGGDAEEYAIDLHSVDKARRKARWSEWVRASFPGFEVTSMWLPELADGNVHNNNNLPIVIAGSMGGYFKQGVAVNLEGAALGTGNSEASCVNGVTDIGFGTGSFGGNVPLNKLYVTLLNGLGATNAGAPITQFGVADSTSLEAGITNPGELTALKVS